MKANDVHSATKPILRGSKEDRFTSALTREDGYSLLLCEEVNTWRFDQLPATVVHKAKLCLIDSLGVTAAAAHAPGISQLDALLARWEKTGSATGLLGKRKYSPPTAALANGTAAHALDFDDQHDMGRVHTACVLLPTLLATAEDVGDVSGEEFLLAYVVGAELHARLGLACYNSLGKGWHPTMVFGTLAASIAAARLLKLDPEGMLSALGMAFHQAAGSAQSMRDGVLSKRIGPGFAARAAVTAVFMASQGLTGTRRPLEGNAGMFALFERGEVHPETLTTGLGREWRMLEYSFKPFPCCRCSHTAIEIGIALHQRGLVPVTVHGVEIRMGKVNWEAVGGGYHPERKSVVHAQFNAAYCFARALADGRLDLRSFGESEIADPAVCALASRIRVIADPAIPTQSLAQVHVRVTLASGEVINLEKACVKGSPADPLTEHELIEKFRNCCSFGYEAENTETASLIEAVLALEHLSDAAGAIVAQFPNVAVHPGARGQSIPGPVARA